jgi:DNA-binding NtrC family response regulator
MSLPSLEFLETLFCLGISTQMQQRNVIVVEPRPRWTPELRRQFAGKNVRVRHRVRIADLKQINVTDDFSVLVLDFDAAPADCLRFLSREVCSPGRLPTIVIGSPDAATLEWTIRDLGALDFFARAPRGDELARLCRRLWTDEE